MTADPYVCIHQISWGLTLEKYQSKGWSQSFDQALYTGRSSKFYAVWPRFQFYVWHISTGHAELGITQYRLSAYHPQSQGALERWHQLLKNMMRIYCFEKEKDWDEGIHLLLFVACESVQESLGFQLVFGHTVRGPQLLKERLLPSSTESINLLQYVSDILWVS